ncbi:class 1 fructose-bisphosphatase [Salipiger mangrovisoli]|uniref:Fructose-1,6-bisphosphatase class 1 n=1 Tax=Salipiger mangrovisoli TaxID=2865933 RepID=A0ABR9X0S8_9RHOB|nr:class 1 fructose-bisphosphatase [Salipiger mangrovisoli]MBE9637168.1 class 1 fructose-bisphosphatase [Salipiger mangrovisoli]
MLTLPNDHPPRGAALHTQLTDSGAARIVRHIAEALPPIADRLAEGLLTGDPAKIVGDNESGDAQKALDVGAHEHMLRALSGCNIRHVLSEEAEAVVTLDPEGEFDVAMDPIDGSGSIGICALLGMLFVVYPAGDGSFRRPGTEAVAAGYACFGHSVDFAWSLGDGVHIATLDRRAGDFRVTAENIRLKAATSMIAVNASNERHWAPGLRAYASDMRAGKDGPLGKNYNMRWLAAAVGDLHRIMLKGGAFLYPQDGRKGYEQGRLRLAYEAIPIAFMVEQAGGRATDGRRRILELVPQEPHGFCPLIFGSVEEVQCIEAYIATHG